MARRVGIVGIGIMGTAMMRNLVSDGFEVASAFGVTRPLHEPAFSLGADLIQMPASAGLVHGTP